MMEDNKQLAQRIDGAIQSASQEVTNLRSELSATSRRLAELGASSPPALENHHQHNHHDDSLHYRGECHSMYASVWVNVCTNLLPLCLCVRVRTWACVSVLNLEVFWECAAGWLISSCTDLFFPKLHSRMTVEKRTRDRLSVVIIREGLRLESVGQSRSRVWFPRQQLGSSGGCTPSSSGSLCSLSLSLAEESQNWASGPWNCVPTSLTGLATIWHHHLAGKEMWWMRNEL